MTAETKILQYLNSLNPAVNFSMLHVKHIHNIMTTIPINQAYAKLNRWNGVTNGYDPIRTIQATPQQIKERIYVALETKPVEGCYRYDCYNAAGEFEGSIYSLNPELF